MGVLQRKRGGRLVMDKVYSYVKVITKQDKLLIVSANKIIEIDKKDFFRFIIKNNKIKYYLTFDDKTFENSLFFLDDKLYTLLDHYGVLIICKDKIFTTKKFNYQKAFNFVKNNKNCLLIRKVKNLFWFVFVKNKMIMFENASEFGSIDKLNLYLEFEKKLYDKLHLKHSIYPQYLFSIGARATLLLKALNVKDWFVNVKPLQKILQQAFVGSRIETAFKGSYNGDIYYYDLNSAYLFAISQIGAFDKIYKTSKYLPGFFGIYKVKFSLFTRFHKFNPFPIKYKDKIVFPSIGVAYVTNYELEEYVKMYGWKGIKVVEGYITKFKDYKFKDVVDKIFTMRKEVKKLGIEQFFKTLGNTIYGKFASPNTSFQNLFVASLITGKVRSMLIPYICDNRNNIIQVFVDSIMSFNPLNVKTDDKIGSFKGFVGKNLHFLGAGKYYIEDPYTFKHLGSNTIMPKDVIDNINNLMMEDRIIQTFRNQNKIVNIKLILVPKTRLIFGSKLFPIPSVNLIPVAYYFNFISMFLTFVISKIKSIDNNYKKVAKIYDEYATETLDKLTNLDII
jgi:hypothetical protein